MPGERPPTHQPTHSFIVIHIYMYTRRDDDDDDGCAHCRALEADISEPGRQAGRQVSTELESIQKRNNPPLSLPILWGTTILRECRSQSHSVSNVCSAISISSIIISLSPSHSRTVVPGRSVYYYYDGDDMREIWMKSTYPHHIIISTHSLWIESWPRMGIPKTGWTGGAGRENKWVCCNVLGLMEHVLLWIIIRACLYPSGAKLCAGDSLRLPLLLLLLLQTARGWG